MHFNFPSISRKFSNLRASDLSSSSSSPSSINAKIRALVQQGQYSEALQLYSTTTTSTHHSLHQQTTDKFTFPSLLKACAALSHHHLGKKIHGSITTSGLQSDPYIATSLINMYIKCGSLSDAALVFERISDSEENLVHDVTLWNSIIDGYFRYGYTDDGFIQFRRMQLLGVRPDAYTLSMVLRSFNDNLSDLLQGKQIHGYLLRNMFDHDPFLDTALIDMYVNCGRSMEACKVFDRLEDKSNTVTWNAIISGFHRNGLWERSLEFFVIMKSQSCKLESSTFSSVLTACSDGDDVVFGREVHCDLIKLGFERDPYVSTSLLTLYSKYRLVEDAKTVFDQIPDKEIELWNAMISAYIGNGYVHEALNVYDQMRLSGSKSDSYTLSNILSGCSMVLLYDFGRIVHGELIKRPVQNNTSVQSSLLTMYSKCGTIQDANLVFSTMKEKDVVTWSSMISGFCQNRKFEEALRLFKEIKAEGVESDSTVMASVVGAFAGLHDVELGCGIHGFVIKNGMGSDVFVGSALIDMYAKFGLPEMAGSVFSAMPQRNLVAWNSIISCYNRNNLPEFSINLFPRIIQHGLNPDSVSITNVIVAISSLAALQKGKTVHGYLVRLKIQSDLQVVNALMDMYIKSGCLKYAQFIFENMPERNIITWNSMISGYGSHGDCVKAFKLFDEMKGSGVPPDEITFLALISSCSHSGLIEEGLRLFQSMKRDYGIEPGMEHYVNMVSLFGRAGLLDEAYRFVQRMPIEPDKSVWLCLLCACRTHCNIQLGELAAEELLKLEPTRGSNYIQLLNLYGEGELWEKAANLRMCMRERGLKKNPGCSWIEIKDQVDVFFSGDSSSPWTLEIYDTLWNLRRNMEGEEEDGSTSDEVTFNL
ncbi:Pentatricopeptide repeat [Macleaya cordata]|uniref:Pentatricopeptide repeat n=1 Tax=Macleaya cordata TaxID=56857 RepID=A0A200R3N3_MACCD|nr:Pentatricopeptide repeat [Macleaya cordata]